jgi:hypothetical protein
MYFISELLFHFHLDRLSPHQERPELRLFQSVFEGSLHFLILLDKLHVCNLPVPTFMWVQCVINAESIQVVKGGICQIMRNNIR